jgi:hypothetical protein
VKAISKILQDLPDIFAKPQHCRLHDDARGDRRHPQLALGMGTL